VIALDLRLSIARAVAEAGFDVSPEPKLRPGGPPGTYASSIALGLVAAAGNGTGRRAVDVARVLASALAAEDWIARASVSAGGYVTVTVTAAALAGVAAAITAAGAACARSATLRGVTVAAVPPADLDTAASWEGARSALAAELAAALAGNAGATVGGEAAAAADDGGGAGRGRAGPGRDDGAGRTDRAGPGRRGPAGDAIAFAGADAVRFALARAIPGKPVRVDPVGVARNSLDNPAYAVRYAHARAVSGVRWAAALATSEEAATPSLPTDPVGWALLDALSWLPERAAVAARRGRPDEFARYLEELARATIAALPHLGPADDERLALAQAMAQAARTALAAGLGLLGVAAPERL
jgi:arginyl-tRNA synthetase